MICWKARCHCSKGSTTVSPDDEEGVDAGIPSGPPGGMTDEMKSALKVMTENGLTLDQLSDGGSADMADKMQNAGLNGDQVKQMTEKGLKLAEIEEALGGKESDALLAKFKAINLPHTIENLAAAGVTPELVAKIEKNGVTLEELGKLLMEPINGSVVSAMAEAVKDIGLVKEANQRIAM